MSKYALPGLVLGVMLTFGVACRAANEERTVTPRPKPASTAATLPAVTSTAPPPSPDAPTATAVPSTPTPGAKPFPSAWIDIGGQTAGFELSVPADWVPANELRAQFGDGALLRADSRATAVRLNDGASLEEGIFLIAYNAVADVAESDPVAALSVFLEAANVTLLQPATAVAVNEHRGAVADILGDPTGALGAAADELQFHTLLLIEPEQERPTLFLWGTPADRAAGYQAIIRFMADSIRLHPLLPPGVAGHLGEGALQTGLLNPGATDIWQFDGQAGRYATVAVRTDDDLDLVLALVAPSGLTLAGVDRGYSGDAEAVFDQLLPESGPYQIEVGDFFDEGGRYTISLIQSDAPQYGGGGQIYPGQAATGNLTAGQDDVWTFQGAAGDLISIVLTPGATQIDIFFELRGPGGKRLVALDESFSGDPEILSGYELPVTGQYQIVVNSFSRNGGPYTLALDEGGESASNFYDAGDLRYGDAPTETLQADEVHAWFFDGRSGHAITLVAAPLDDGLDLDVWLLDPDLQRLAMKDEALFGQAETISLTLPADGEYIVVVREYYGTGGDYAIELSSSNYAADAGTLAFGRPVTGALAAGFADGWALAGRSGQAITVTLEPLDGGDAAFWLVSPDGRLVETVQARGPGQAETLAGFVLDADGVWRIVVREAKEEGGDYRLLVTRE